MKAITRASLGTVVIAAVIATGCASKKTEPAAGDPGFLRDYSKLQTTKDTSGKEIRAWASPKLTPQNYHSVLIEPIRWHPEPAPSERVSAACT